MSEFDDSAFRIVAPHFVAAVIFTGSHVTQAAPIVRYMKNWHLDKFLAYCLRKNWEIERL